MTEAELREMYADIKVLLAGQKRQAGEQEKLAGRVEALERVPRGASNGPNGRRLRDRALSLGRDGLLVALLAEVAYRIVTGG